MKQVQLGMQHVSRQMVTQVRRLLRFSCISTLVLGKMLGGII